MMKSLLLALCMTCCVTGCSQKKVCTEMGCLDAASLRLQSADNRWADGDYELTVTAGDTSTTCSFTLPDDFPSTGSPQPLTCNASIGHDVPILSQVHTCTETRTDDAVSQSCTPVADEYTLEIDLPGTPNSVEIQLKRDGATLIDDTQVLTYKATRPNGPGCDPLCRQASVVVAVP